MRPIKFATYLDEAGDEPASACINAKAMGFNYVVLRHLWSSNVASLNDTACQSIMKLLKDNELTPIMLASEIGQVPASTLMSHKSAIDRLFDLAFFFKVPMVRVFVGDYENKSELIVKNWMAYVQEKAILSGITPVLEVTHGSSLFNPITLVQTLSSFKRWKLLYDPAQFIIKQAQDPFVRFWTLIKSYVSCLDIHDFKIGHGHKPPGYGDTKLVPTLNDALATLPECWYLMEPALGRKYGPALTKLDVFKLALDSLDALELKEAVK
mgnify:CR=1 FL=1